MTAPSTRIASNCVCGQLQLQFPVSVLARTSQNLAVDCHCPNCRHHHISGFVSYLQIPKDEVSIIGPKKYVRDKCYEVGDVERIQCSNCSSKLATRILNPEHSGDILVNMGPLIDESIPKNFADQWKFYRKQWQTDKRVSWATAVPTNAEREDGEHVLPPQTRRRILGGCGCGASRYELDAPFPNEIQHCYCRLCRQFSGAPFMSWMPIWDEGVDWTSAVPPLTKTPDEGFPSVVRYGPPPLTRTTPHGQRHFCPECEGALTIVYDEQPDLMWPAVGGFDDEHGLPKDPQEMNDALYRAVHISCQYQQTWYTIPQDGLPRIGGAS